MKNRKEQTEGNVLKMVTFMITAQEIYSDDDNTSYYAMTLSSNAFGREPRKESKKANKKPKKPGDEPATVITPTHASKEQEKAKEEENKKHAQVREEEEDDDKRLVRKVEME